MAVTTPNTAPTGAPIPDAQAGASAIQLDQSQVQLTPNAMEEDQSQKGPVASPDGKIPPVQQNVDVTTNNSQQMPTENADTSNLGLNPDDPKNKMQQTPAYQTPAQHPAVQKASLLHEIATTLAGGPRYQTSIDPNTGQVTRSQVPLSNRQLGMAIALEALSGGIKGIAQTGPNHSAKAAAAGFQQGQEQAQQQQQAQQDQESQAKSDFALKAQTTKNNFQMYQLTRQQSELDYDNNVKHTETYDPLYETAQENGGIKEDGVEGTSADDIAKRFNVSKDLVIPHGKPLPRYDPATGQQAVDPKTGALQWNLQFSILDPDRAGNISPALAKKASDYAVPGSFTLDKDGNRVPIKLPESVQLKLGLQASWTNAIAAIDTAQAHIGQKLSNLPDGDKYVKELDENLKHAYENKVSQAALSTVSRLASAVPIDQWQETMKTLKTPLDVMGQVMSLIPQDAMDAAEKATAQKKTDAAVATDTAKRNANPTSVEQAESVVSSPTATPVQKQAAQKLIALDKQTKAQEAYSGEANRFSAEVNMKNKFGIPLTNAGEMSAQQVANPNVWAAIRATPPNNDPSVKLVGGMRPDRMQALESADPALAAEIQAIGEGRQVQSKYGLAKAAGIQLGELVQSVYPSYTQPKAESYEALQKRFTSGDISDQLRALNTTFEHADRAIDAAGSKAAVIPGTDAHADWETDKSQLTEELHHAYTKGVLNVERMNQLQAGLSSVIPSVRQEAARNSIDLLSDFAGEFQNTWSKGKASDAVPKAQIVTEEGQNAFNKVFSGKQSIDTYGRVTKIAPPKGAVGTMKHTDDGTVHWVDAQHNDLGLAPSQSSQ